MFRHSKDSFQDFFKNCLNSKLNLQIGSKSSQSCEFCSEYVLNDLSSKIMSTTTYVGISKIQAGDLFEQWSPIWLNLHLAKNSFDCFLYNSISFPYKKYPSCGLDYGHHGAVVRIEDWYNCSKCS